MENEVKVIKLISGEEIIARMTDSQDGFLHLERPKLVHPLPPNAAGQLGVGLAPWCLAGEPSSIKIETKHVMVNIEPKKDIEKSYLSAITGITL